MAWGIYTSHQVRKELCHLTYHPSFLRLSGRSRVMRAGGVVPPFQLADQRSRSASAMSPPVLPRVPSRYPTPQCRRDSEQPRQSQRRNSRGALGPILSRGMATLSLCDPESISRFSGSFVGQWWFGVVNRVVTRPVEGRHHDRQRQA